MVGRWYCSGEPTAEPSTVVVIVPGGGILAQFYERLARYLAERGAAVLTFDYRGIGESRRGTLRGLHAPIEVWGQLDVGAALKAARCRYPSLPLGVVAHSIGSLILGAAQDAGSISRLVFFAPHTAYFGDYGRRCRWLLYLTWHVLMPSVTKMVGYFPGRALRLGQDLPKGFAMDWAGRRKPGLMATREYRERFAAILAQYGRVRARALAITVTDDAFAPADAARRLLAVYPGISAVHEIVSPADLGAAHLGHMAFISRWRGEYFWRRAAAWLLPTESIGRASSMDAAVNPPPIGTTERASTGSATATMPRPRPITTRLETGLA